MLEKDLSETTSKLKRESRAHFKAIKKALKEVPGGGE